MWGEWGILEKISTLPDVAKKMELDGISPDGQYLWN